ncbi:M23 family metallopeptidase [Halobacillus fulvus]|nr:M23 family metallopeptidase [Halobacillus fulvus]
MKNNIQRVRKSISERKRRKFHGKPLTKDRPPFLPPQDEEVHGFPPLVTEGNSRKMPQKPSSSSSSLGTRVVISLLLFGVIAIGNRTEIGVLEQSEQWVSAQLQEDFPFAKATSWYEDRFGDPLQVLSSNPRVPNSDQGLALPVNGTVTTSFQSNGKGVVMTTDDGSEVRSVREGTVIFAGNDKETDKTVILQHEDGSKTMYGMLSSIEVHLYDYIDAKTTVGSVESENGETAEFFFAIEKNQQYLDPVEVIKVDEPSS